MRRDHGRRARPATGTLALIVAFVLVGVGARAARAADSFTLTPSTPTVGATITFTASLGDPVTRGTTLSWDFGDGSPSASGTSVTHTYTSPGTETVALTVTSTSTSGRESTTVLRRDVSVRAALQAAFTWSPGTPNAGDQVRFDGSGSTSPDGRALSYRWDFGDGSTGSGAAPTHAYSSSGDRTVTLTVTAGGASNSASQQVHVADVAPQTGIALKLVNPSSGQDPATPVVGEPVLLAAQDASASIASYAWDLGNGTFGAPTPVPYLLTSFGSAGDLAVRLRVTDSGGATATVTLPVHVDAPPAAGFGISPASPTTADRVTLTSFAYDPDGPGDLRSITWDLNGDGVFGDASGPTASTVFPTPGDYTVAQQVVDGSGASATVFGTIPVTAAPPPASSASPGSHSSGALKVLTSVRLRLAGTVADGRTTLTTVSLFAPKGATIAVRCHGRGCPKAFTLQVARTRSVRLPQLQRRFRAGARVTIVVRAPGFMPKRIRVTFRRARAPLREERCLVPSGPDGRTRAVTCPS